MNWSTLYFIYLTITVLTGYISVSLFDQSMHWYFVKDVALF